MPSSLAATVSRQIESFSETEPYQSLAIDGDRLYHKSPLGDVFCLDAKTGKKLWDLNILEKFGSKNIQWALSESLLVDGDHVICCPFGEKALQTGMWERPIVDADHCVGCGLCENSCIVYPQAIRVRPASLPAERTV